MGAVNNKGLKVNYRCIAHAQTARVKLLGNSTIAAACTKNNAMGAAKVPAATNIICRAARGTNLHLA